MSRRAAGKGHHGMPRKSSSHEPRRRAGVKAANKLDTVLWLMNGSDEVSRETQKIVLSYQRSRRQGRRPFGAMDRFNRLADRSRVRLSLFAIGTFLMHTWSTEGGDGAEGVHLQRLWEVLGTPGAVDRLKRCAQCRNWFADLTQNRSKTRCSSACTWRWWNRARRRDSRHRPSRRDSRAVRHGGAR